MDTSADLTDLASASGQPPVGGTVHYYLPHERRPRSAPEYIGLRVVAGLALCYAAVMYVMGLVMLMAAVATVIDQSKRGEIGSAPGVRILALMVGSLAGLGVMFGGLLAHALSNGCAALRDIARNSYRL